MAYQNLDVVGAYFKEGPGFIILTDTAFPTTTGMAAARTCRTIAAPSTNRRNQNQLRS